MEWSKLRKIIEKHLGKIVYGMLVVCAAMGWWGILYPQLTLTPETYRVVSDQAVESEAGIENEWNFDDHVYEEILNADSSQIRFHSKLFIELSKSLKSLWDEE